MVLITVVKITIVACTFIGNLFVIIAILIDKNLQTPANQLVLSLAVADLMVACLVMPLGTYNDYHDGWWLGKEVCEFWTSADVLCCTASILNLLAIALDRYWAVTNVDYIYKRTRKRVNLMILCAWTVGAIVSLAPIFGWKDPDFARRVLEEHKCLVSQDVAYQIFATISTFYAPLVLLLALYWRIFKVARKRIHCKPGGKLATVVGAATQQQQHRKHHQEKQTVATTSNLIIRGAASGPFSKQKGLLSAVAPRSTHQSGGSMASLVTTEPEHKKQQPPPSSSSLTTSASQTSQHDHHQLQPSKVLVVQNDEPSRSPSVVVVTGSAQLAAQPDQKSIAQRGTPHLACEEAPYATGGSPLASLAADSREARNVSLTGACLTGDDEAQLQLAQPERDANNFKPFGGTRGGTKQDNDYEDEEEKKKKTVASSIVAPATAQIGVDSGGGSSTQDSAKLTTLTTNDIFTGSTTCAGGGGGQSDATERCPATAARASRHQREETKEEEQTGRRLKGDGGARFASVCLATNKSVDGFMLKNKERQCRGTQFAAVPVQQQQQQLSQASSNCRQEGARCFSSLAADAASGELNSAVVASMNEKRICLPMNNNNRNHHHQKQQQHRTSCTRDSGHKLDVDDEQATREALVSAVARPASGVGSTNDQRRNDCQDRQCSSNQRRSSLVLQADQFLCSSFSMRSHNHNNNYSPTTTRPSTTAQATTTCATARLTSGAPPLAEMATKTTQMEQRRAPSDANEVLKLLRCTPLASLAAGRQARQEQFTSRTINSRGEPANEQANNRVSSREPGLGMVLAKYDDDDDDDDDVTARGRAGSEGCSGKSGEQRHRNHQLDRDRGNHQGACGHDEPSSLAVVGVQKRASLVQLDVQMLSSNCVSGAQSSSSHNNNYDDNIDDISPTNSLSECLCCCCLHTMERTSFTSGDEDDDDGNELDDDDEEFDEDEDDGQHYANDNDHLAAVATMNELLKHQQDSAKDKPMAAAEAVAVAAVSTALSTQRPWHANDARSGPGGAGGGIRRARRNSREQTGGGLAGTAVCWQSDKLGLIQHQQSRHGLSVETRTADGSECTCKRSEGAVSQMLAAHRKLLLASQGFKGADDDDDGGLESHAFVQLQPPQPTTTLSRESTTNNTAGAATTRHLATTNRLVGGREARVGPRRAKGASSAAAMDRRSGVFLSMSSSSSASSLVVSSSSSSSRSMLAAAAVAKLEHPDGQMIEQFLELAEGQQQQAVCVRTTTASCCVEGEQKERLPEAPEATPTRISTTYSPMADGIGVDDVRASLWQSSAPNEEEEAESNEERTGAAVGPSHPARRLPTCWPAPTFAGTTTTIEISRSTSDRGRHVDTGRTSGGLANDDNDNVDSTGASANQSNANTTPMRTTGLPTLETTTNSDNGKGRHHRGQEGHLAAGGRAAQVAPGRQQQQQKQQQQQQQEEPISGTVGERYLEPGPSSNGRSLAASAASRASGIKRRFRALGQLVSFVQTSRQFNSSSSAHTSQSGAEEDDNSSMGAGGSGSGGSGSGSGSGSGAGFNHHGALEEGVSRGCSRITTTRTMTTTTTSTTMTTTTSSTARTLAMATSINQQTNIVTGAATLDNAQEAKINERHEEDGNFLSDNDGLANGARNRNNLNKSLNKNRKTLTPGLVVSISGSRHQGGDLADKLMEEPGIGPRAPQASMEHDEQQDDNQLRRKQQNLSLLVSARAVVSGHQAIAPAAKTGPLPPPSGLQPPANAARKTSAGQPRPRDQCSAQQRRQNLEMKREKKAAKTLAIITGVFVCCWLPFFLNAIVMPICGPACTPSDLILSVLLWLGYLNSLLNPIIYTIFSPDFRRAFHRLLCWPELSRPRMLINSATGSGGLSGRMALDSKYGKRRLRAANVSGGCPRQR